MEKTVGTSSPDALEYIHIIGRAREKILADLQSLGRTNVEFLCQKENGMYLCVVCHRGLDDHELPAWVFLPSNIDFFIEAEHANYHHRTQELMTTATFPKRTPPSPQAYIQTCGGVYDVYMLRPYGAPNGKWQRGRSTYQPNPKVWHGDPMLALYKAFKFVSGFRYLLPSALQQLDELHEFNDLGPPPDAAICYSQHCGDDDDNPTLIRMTPISH
ncbi:MAG: hypothetical protein Q9225_006988 [Loekoesia sp. 1 TL-2023]